MTSLVHERLTGSPLEIEGRLVDASNATLLCTLDEGRCVYKPVAGENPLWDFDAGTLGYREVASYEIDHLLDWGYIPCTVWRDDAPLGPGMVQEWREDAAVGEVITVCAPDDVPNDWLVVLEARDPAGRPVCLAHANSSDLQRMCILDAIINNGDRKGGHVLTDAHGSVFAVDHGVTFHTDNKLRTVVWGWAGESIPAPLLADVARLRDVLSDRHPRVDTWLQPTESIALRQRIDALIETGSFPLPSPEWPAIPWPVF